MSNNSDWMNNFLRDKARNDEKMRTVVSYDGMVFSAPYKKMRTIVSSDGMVFSAPCDEK